MLTQEEDWERQRLWREERDRRMAERLVQQRLLHEADPTMAGTFARTCVRKSASRAQRALRIPAQCGYTICIAPRPPTGLAGVFFTLNWRACERPAGSVHRLPERITDGPRLLRPGSYALNMRS